MRGAVLPGPFRFWTRTHAKPIHWQRKLYSYLQCNSAHFSSEFSHLCTKCKYQRMELYEVPYFICNTDIPAWGDAPLKPHRAPIICFGTIFQSSCQTTAVKNGKWSPVLGVVLGAMLGVMLESRSMTVLLFCSYTWESKGLHGAFSLGAVSNVCLWCTFKPFWNPWFPHPYPVFPLVVPHNHFPVFHNASFSSDILPLQGAWWPS